jgi:hypothetical protein
MRVKVIDDDGTVRWCSDKRRLDPEQKYMFEKQPEREQAKQDGRSTKYYSPPELIREFNANNPTNGRQCGK